MSWSVFGKATFSDWIPTDAFADTGERFREKRAAGRLKRGRSLRRSGGVAPSAACLGEMQGVLIPAVKVSTDAQCKKFRDMLHAHLVPGGRSLLDFPASPLSGTPTCSR